MNPRHTPFLRLLLPWVAGLAAGAWLNRPLQGLEYGLMAGMAALVLGAKQRYAYRFRWVFGSVLALLLLGAGYYHAVQHDERRGPAHFSVRAPNARVFIGTVYDAPGRGRRLKVPFRMEAAGPSADSLSACTGNILLFFEITPAAEQLRYGDRLWVEATIHAAEPPPNPHAFDYRRYLHFQNIHYQAFVKDNTYGVIAAGFGYLPWRVAFRWRDRLLALLQEHFPGTDEYAVASALLVGYKDELSDELRAAYTETGSMHALAVSGTHVGLLYAGLLFLLRRVYVPGRAGYWSKTLAILAAIWAFTLLTGATASVLRASVMFSTYLVGKAIHRQASVWNILAASAFGLLLLNPYLLFDAGFQLSYAAVAGLVLFYPYLKKRSPPLPRWAEEGWSILLIGVAAQLGTLPLSLYYFHQFPVYFWLSGWVVVLGGAVFLWGGALLVVLHVLAPALATWLGWGLYYLVWGMNALILGIQQLPGSLISDIWVAGWAVALLYGLIGMSTYALVQYKPRWLLGALALTAILAACRLVQQTGQIHHREMVLYQANRHFLLDFFDGGQVYVWVDSIDERREQFVAGTHRQANGVFRIRRLGIDRDTVFVGANLFIRRPFVQFFSKKMVLLDHPALLAADAPPVAVDVLLLRNNPNVRLIDCHRRFLFKRVVFDASNSSNRVTQWKNECRQLALPCHDIRENGAWIDKGL